MNKRQAKRHAHWLVARMVDGWVGSGRHALAPDDPDDRRILDALDAITQHHFDRGEQFPFCETCDGEGWRENYHGDGSVNRRWKCETCNGTGKASRETP